MSDPTKTSASDTGQRIRVHDDDPSARRDTDTSFRQHHGDRRPECGPAVTSIIGLSSRCHSSVSDNERPDRIQAPLNRGDLRPIATWDVTPLVWWRRFAADRFGDAEQRLLRATLDRIRVLRADRALTAALKGDPPAAIRVVARLLPIKEINLSTDVAMSALLRTALAGDPAAALVLGSALRGTRCDDLTKLAASWLKSPHKPAERSDRRRAVSASSVSVESLPC